MTPDRQTAQALTDTFTAAQIRDYRLQALKVKMEGGTVTRSYEGSSFTISRENCEQIIADTNEAISILAAADIGDDRDATRDGATVGFDFSTRWTS